MATNRIQIAALVLSSLALLFVADLQCQWQPIQTPLWVPPITQQAPAPSPPPKAPNVQKRKKGRSCTC